MARVTTAEVKAKMDEALDALADTFDDGKWWGTTAFKWASDHHKVQGKPTYFERQEQKVASSETNNVKAPRFK